MNKKNFITTIVLIAFMAIGTTAEAQIKFGLRAEVGLNKPTFSTKEFDKNFQVENMNTFKVGPSLEYMLPVFGLGVDASLLYSNEKMNVQYIDANGAKISDITAVQSHNLELPVNLKYKIGIISVLKAYLAAGPYIGVNVANDDLTKLDAIADNIKQNKFQAGMNFGFGAEVIDRVQVGFNYHLKLTDDYSIDQPKVSDIFNKENKGFWSLTAALYF